MRKLLTLAVFGLTLAAGYSLASGPGTRPDVPRDQWLSPDAIRADLAARGYEVRKLKTEDRYYEAYATTADGRRVEVYVDPVSGEILKEKEDD